MYADAYDLENGSYVFVFRLFVYDQADSTAIRKPHHLLPHLNPNWFTFLYQLTLGCPGKQAFKRL